MGNLVYTFSWLAGRRPRGQKGFLDDDESHQRKADRSDPEADLLRGKLWPRVRTFWRVELTFLKILIAVEDEMAVVCFPTEDCPSNAVLTEDVTSSQLEFCSGASVESKQCWSVCGCWQESGCKDRRICEGVSGCVNGFQCLLTRNFGVNQRRKVLNQPATKGWKRV